MKLFFTVRQKLAIVLLAAGALFFAAILFALYKDYKDFIIKKNVEELEVISDLMARRLQADISDIKSVLLFVASHNEILIKSVEKSNISYGDFSDQGISIKMNAIDEEWNKSGSQELRNYLGQDSVNAVLEDFSRMSRMPLIEVSVADIRGGLVAANRKTDDYYQADEEWWQKVYKGGIGSFNISEMEYDSISQQPVFSFSCPVVNSNGMVVGVMRVLVEKDRFLAPSFNIYFGRGGYTGVMTSYGGSIYNSYSGTSSNILLKSLFDYFTRHNTKSEKILKIRGVGSFLVGFSKIYESWLGNSGPWFIYCVKDSRHVLAPLNRTAGYLTIVWFFVMICLYWLIMFITHRFVEPLEHFRKACANLKKGKFEVTLQIASGDEFEELASDFNDMVDELRRSTVSREYFNKIIQNMSDILFVVNSYGSIDLANKRASELLCYDEDELKGKEAIEIFSKKDRYIISWGLKGLIEEGALKDKKICLVTKAGKEIEVYLGTRSIRDSSGNLLGLVCLAKDMTEITRLLNDLQKSNEEIQRHKDELERSLKELTENRDVMLSILEDTDESKKQLEETLRKLKETQGELLQAEKMISLGQIAAGVAHEINNPLFVISGEAEMMSMDKNLSVSVAESVKVIREQVDRIGDIIKRLLEFSRKRETKFVPVDINEILQKSIELLKYQAKALGHVEIVSRLTHTALMVKGDFNQLHEVFVNIMLNAVQAMEEKGGSLTLMSYTEIIEKGVSEKFKAGAKVAVIEFKDKGIGMSEETMKRIFDPFFTTKKTGIGLGLAVCFGIIENHGGIIEVESQLGKGTIFSIKLPLIKEEKQR